MPARWRRGGQVRDRLVQAQAIACVTVGAGDVPPVGVDAGDLPTDPLQLGVVVELAGDEAEAQLQRAVLLLGEALEQVVVGAQLEGLEVKVALRNADGWNGRYSSWSPAHQLAILS